ncbi:FkbM family methyltransferase [Winogradskyella ouciana]|uniref:FkbM family methyltransferase n=1 Tax=Winogradskyella ouciana TaxID=2608631 RepID=UPI003D299C3F
MLVYLYKKIPKSLRNRIGKTKSLKWFRDFLLRKDGIYKERTVNIKRSYLDYNVEFKFVASIKEASNALIKGIENTMLCNSIVLLRKRREDLNNITILDVGANFGYLSLVWSQTVCKTGKVVAFEPSVDVYKSLGKSVASNKVGNIVELVNVAVGNENKLVELFLNDSTSNVIQSDDKQQSNTVQMVRIDDYVKDNNLNCDLIKIDVDGIEFDILKGSIDTLRKFNPIYIVETNDDTRIVEFFEGNNYSVLNEKLEPYTQNQKLPPNVYCVSKA